MKLFGIPSLHALSEQYFMSSAARRVLKGRTFYDILEVPRLSKPEDIRTAYLGLARKYHPDSQPVHDALQAVDVSDSAARFREIQEAYSTLSNSWKRTLYDQDLQYQEAAAATGGQNGMAAWRENFNQETPEARIARRERYKRYAVGERNDLPPVSLTTKASLIGFVVAGSALTYVCAQAPDWFGGQDEQTYHDPVTDDLSVSLVQAFFNPITRKWERLGDGQIVPTFEELLTQYKRIAPALIDRWQYEEAKEENSVENIDTLTVIKVPKTRTIAATVYKSSEGDVKINRRTLNDAISRFSTRIGKDT